MSWFKFIPPTVSDIDNMIERNATLEEFLDYDDLSSNYKSQNKALIEYFSKPDVIKKLLSYLVNLEKNTDVRQYKYSFLAADLLSEDIAVVRDVLLQPDNINILFDAILQSPSIEAPYAHHICRLFHSLLTQCGKEVLIQIEEKNIVPKMFDHLQSFPFCELLFDIIMIIEQQNEKTGVIEFFHKYDVIYNLLHEMQTSPHFLVPPNAGQILTNIVRNFAPTHRFILFTEIFRPKETEILCSISLNPSLSILNFTHGISLLIDIVWNTRFNPEDPNTPLFNSDGQPLDLSATPPDALNPPAPPQFITDNILTQLSLFVECLAYDWSSVDGGGGGGGGDGKGDSPSSPSSPSSSPSSPSPSSPTSNSTSSSTSMSKCTSPYTHPYPSPSPHPSPTSKIFIPCPPILRGGRSVGNYRLKLLVLFSTLIRSGYDDSIDDAFITSRAFLPLVALFFAHPANNVIHSELYTLFEQTMLFRTPKLKIDLCVTNKLADRVADALLDEKTRRAERQAELAALPESQQQEPSKIRPSAPFLAHVLHLARILEEHRVTVPEVDTALKGHIEWEECFHNIVEPQMKEQESGLLPPPAESEDVGFMSGQYEGYGADPAEMWGDLHGGGGGAGMGGGVGPDEFNFAQNDEPPSDDQNRQV